MKTFRVNHIPYGRPESLAALIHAKDLSSAEKELRRRRGLRLPGGIYYIFEEGRYENGLQITLPAGRENLK